MHHSNQVAVSAVELVVAQVVELARLLRLLARRLRRVVAAENDDGERLLALRLPLAVESVVRAAVRQAAARRARREVAERHTIQVGSETGWKICLTLETYYKWRNSSLKPTA